MEQDRTIYYTGCRKEMIPFVPAGSKKILEVGCGEGNFISQLKSGGAELWGVEPDQVSARIAGTKLFKVLNNTIEEALGSLPDKYFDVLVLNDVLEHMLYPGDNLRKLKAKLNSSGQLVASIPNFRYVKSLFQVAVKGNWRYRDHGILDQTHIRFFTRKSIRDLFEDSGYDIIMVKGINRTKSIKFHLLVFLFSLLTLTSHLDMLYLQFAVVARTKDPKNILI